MNLKTTKIDKINLNEILSNTKLEENLINNKSLNKSHDEINNNDSNKDLLISKK